MSVSICNRFHTIRANNGKTTSFMGYSYLTPTFERNPRTQGHEILSQKIMDLEAAHGEDFVILACTVFYTVPGCDGRTDGRLDNG